MISRPVIDGFPDATFSFEQRVHDGVRDLGVPGKGVQGDVGVAGQDLAEVGEAMVKMLSAMLEVFKCVILRVQCFSDVILVGGIRS